MLSINGRAHKSPEIVRAYNWAREVGFPQINIDLIAGMVGASRERVNKAIASFIRLGWIEQIDRRYRITNREQLTRRAR